MSLNRETKHNYNRGILLCILLCCTFQLVTLVRWDSKSDSKLALVLPRFQIGSIGAKIRSSRLIRRYWTCNERDWCFLHDTKKLIVAELAAYRERNRDSGTDCKENCWYSQLARGNFLPEFEFLFDVCTRNIIKRVVFDLMLSFSFQN